MGIKIDELLQRVHPLVGYAAEAEALVLSSHGRPLTALQLTDARLVGVRDPDRIRLATSFAFMEADPRFTVFRTFGPVLAGVTVGYAIVLASDLANKRDMLLHECAHVAQYERLGINGFLQRYFAEYERYGYEQMPLEQEAIAAVHQVMFSP